MDAVTASLVPQTSFSKAITQVGKPQGLGVYSPALICYQLGMNEKQFNTVDRIRQNLVQDIALKLYDDGVDHETLAAAYMMQGFSFLCFENETEQSMRDKFIKWADDISRHRLNQLGFDCE